MPIAVTTLESIPVKVNGQSSVTPIKITDLSTGDNEIVAASAGNIIAVVGITMIEGSSAYNLTFKSGTTTHVTLEFAANSGLVIPIGPPLFVTQVGESLVMSSPGTISSVILYVQKARTLHLDSHR